jgi:hypothetical protein
VSLEAAWRSSSLGAKRKEKTSLNIPSHSNRLATLFYDFLQPSVDSLPKEKSRHGTTRGVVEKECRLQRRLDFNSHGVNQETRGK